ncbi:zinc finger, C3HC4 type-domain-containing protein [Hyaloraphidium curvatum]|nr:zinc finger, C3HC4 type-domain-containing protein [Hyaloraphidium curvatum]
MSRSAPFPTKRPDKSHPLYKTALCVHFAAGDCFHGANCSFAHSEKELRQKPCKFGPSCRSERCTYYHGEDDEEEQNQLPTPPRAASDLEPIAASKPKTVIASPSPASVGPWKLVVAEPPKPPAPKATTLADLPDLVARVSKLGFSEERVAWASYRVALGKNLAPGAGILDSEVVDLLAANPKKERKATTAGESAGAKECMICLDEEREVVLVPCGHATLCFNCGEDIKRRGNCPTCRQEVRSIMRVFL